MLGWLRIGVAEGVSEQSKQAYSSVLGWLRIGVAEGVSEQSKQAYSSVLGWLRIRVAEMVSEHRMGKQMGYSTGTGDVLEWF